jgi:hypothetical protein
MREYHPKIYVFYSIVASILTAFAFPVYGFYFTKLIFIMMGYGYVEDYDYWRHFWSGLFLAF